MAKGLNEISLFWDFTQRRLVLSYRRFGEAYLSRSLRDGYFVPKRRYLTTNLRCVTPQMRSIGCPEPSVTNYRFALRYIPEEIDSLFQNVGNHHSRLPNIPEEIIGCPETSVTNTRFALRYIPEEIDSLFRNVGNYQSMLPNIPEEINRLSRNVGN